MALKGMFYSDGSCRSPHGSGVGKIGWGVHGFLYENEVTKPVNADDHVLTTKGYVHKSNITSGNQANPPLPSGEFVKVPDVWQGATQFVEPVKYIDAFGSSLDAATNNIAELMGLINVLNKSIDLGLSEIYVLTDSEYTKRGTKEWLTRWVHQNWIKQDGTPVGNIQYWKQIHALLTTLKSKDIAFDIEWVKAHDSNQGNVQADLLAAVGCNYSFHNELIVDWRESDPRGYWKVEVDKHPFINFKRIYFNSLQQFNIPGHYYQADPGGNDFIIGKRLPETGYSVIKLNEEDPVIEAVKQKQFDVSRSMNAIYMMKLDAVHHKTIYPYIYNYGKHSLHKFKKNNNLVFIDDTNTPVTTEINPTGLSLRAIESFNFLEEMLDKYIHYRDTGENPNDDIFKIQLYDATPHFFDISEKTVKQEIKIAHTLKPELVVGFRDMTVLVPRENREFKIPLILGVDLPPRNSLKKLEDLRPKVTILTFSESEKSFRYCIIIECSNAVGVWSNYYADRIML